MHYASNMWCTCCKFHSFKVYTTVDGSMFTELCVCLTVNLRTFSSLREEPFTYQQTFLFLLPQPLATNNLLSVDLPLDSEHFIWMEPCTLVFVTGFFQGINVIFNHPFPLSSGISHCCSLCLQCCPPKYKDACLISCWLNEFWTVLQVEEILNIVY